MPKPPDVQSEMILRHARAYAHTQPLPTTEREFAEVLFNFSTLVSGSLETMLDRALTIQRDMLNLSFAPLVISKGELRITEAPDA